MQRARVIATVLLPAEEDRSVYMPTRIQTAWQDSRQESLHHLERSKARLHLTKLFPRAKLRHTNAST